MKVLILHHMESSSLFIIFRPILSSLRFLLHLKIEDICDRFLKEFRRLDTKMKITHKKCPVCKSEEEVVMLYFIYRMGKSDQIEKPSEPSE